MKFVFWITILLFAALTTNVQAAESRQVEKNQTESAQAITIDSSVFDIDEKLDRKERRKIRKELRKNKDKVETVLLVILALLLPPLAVFLADGLGTMFWIDLLLTLFFWLPGVIFALFVVLT